MQGKHVCMLACENFIASLNDEFVWLIVEAAAGMIGIRGSALFPPPAYPNNLLVWLFFAYMMIGLGWLLVQRVRDPKMIPAMTDAIEGVELEFANAERVSKRPVLGE